MVTAEAAGASGLRVLVLRPKAAGLRTAARLATLGHAAVAAPVMAIARTHAPPPEGPFDALAVTSAASLPAMSELPEAMKALPVLAVGEQTALLARAGGFGRVHAADGERHSLARLAGRLFATGSGTRVLLALGRDHKADTEALLRAAGVDPVAWIVYAAQAKAELPEAARGALAGGQIDAVLHYSRRSAAIAIDLVDRAGLWPAFAPLPHLALSEDVAAPLRERGVPRLLVAGQPHEEALLALLSGIDLKQGSP
ncbi:uroporphyrinogen-III synthase [Pseudochelatococcus lubricantis]|uniref:Uroporphyrinogen-III synthase n=1 Tax=Pseudochelatococcus lubricantis TaxID=1538102 RepID=A0ABX0V2R1_9HYPH|nr:uroporphyrinogen-III synthase [Pseudochelatococcus lubricantis]NIJ57321.1 uroporphyrinogen-III synthase [Pseudochelatococcus lubricantis]